MNIKTSANVDAAAIGRAASEVFDWPEVKPAQLEAVQSVIDGHDTLVVMPTGYGKSAIYLLAGLFVPGVTVVVSPLIALQTDQVASISDHEHAPNAYAINSKQGKRSLDAAWQAAESGDAEYLFIAPEQFASAQTIAHLAECAVNLFVIDEAHCVSSWGHDFRPDYLRLDSVVEDLGRPTMLALTATGSPPVRQEIIERLRMRRPRVLAGGFDRPNLRLEVVRHADDQLKRQAVLDDVSNCDRPGLVYVPTRKDTAEYAEALAERGLRAAGYHAGMAASDRDEVYQRFLGDDLDVVVATSAFGMGIDKPNVRFVVHAAVTDSLDSYYHEVGRAGRDAKPARATLHYRQEDLSLMNFFASGTPEAEDIRATFSALARADAPRGIRQLASSTGLKTRQVSRVVNLLQEAVLAKTTRRGVSAIGDADVDNAVSRVEQVAREHEKISRSRLEMMRGYAETGRCRRQFLLGYFGEELGQPCGNCDLCDAGVAAEHDDLQPASRYAPGAVVRHTEWGAGTVVRADGDRVTVFFDGRGYTVLSIPDVEAGDLLELG